MARGPTRRSTLTKLERMQLEAHLQYEEAAFAHYDRLDPIHFRNRCLFLHESPRVPTEELWVRNSIATAALTHVDDSFRYPVGDPAFRRISDDIVGEICIFFTRPPSSYPFSEFLEYIVEVFFEWRMDYNRLLVFGTADLFDELAELVFAVGSYRRGQVVGGILLPIAR